MSSQPSLEVYETAERVRVEQSDLLSDVEGLRINNVIQPMSSIGIKQSRKVGGNPLGLEEVGQQCMSPPSVFYDRLANQAQGFW